ncbi:MAG TPA: HAMP domain-containing sensor histidine kinase [Patescibacteria group bacterium]|jgi:signal transduction histidine kinase|nr:HAMP domain-containing sensor histidine kinase [Patescibacteria group bacterium]
MFRSARLKLTAWYLLIIMIVSIAFSVVIYRVLTSEVDRFARAQRTRIERRLLDEGLVQPGSAQLPPPPITMDPDLVLETEHRVLLILFVVNGAIFFISGGLGYILAGRTLTPIQQMVDEQNRFISDASHELRTPLTALKSSIEVNLRDKKLTLATARELLSGSIGQVNKLQSLSDSLLELVQYQQPNVKIAFTTVSLSEITTGAIQRVTPQAKVKQVTIQNQTNGLAMTGSKEYLIDLLVILLDNAIKYSDGKTKITVVAKRTDGDITIRVHDEGIGIAQKDIPHIFDRFYRADTARAREQEGGYGLGLSIAKKITDVHHGSISVESKSGHGSTFIVHLPIHQRKLA